ncbi:hypothetical protein LPTSP2_37730 [Leptospira ellinghausenii]|uniref:Uncharacterized protein n=1 Tax=Leptospira ellinghausenii TaxID=1917822 RepID=A0A2P2DIR6_9LEPT|nr:hypothetical protein [Leptospira ellinghausenii]GBF44470.1 hypothetical protein LPTSP2_37730 [Leptospira ellinghausenii]
MGSVLEKFNITENKNRNSNGYRLKSTPTLSEHFQNSDLPTNLNLRPWQEFEEAKGQNLVFAFIVRKEDEGLAVLKMNPGYTKRIAFAKHVTKSEFSLNKEIIKSEVTYIPGIGKLKKPLQIKLEFEDNLWFIENDYLGIYDHGTSSSEAWLNFSETFRYLLEDFKNTPDMEKHESFKDAERKFREYVDSQQ